MFDEDIVFVPIDDLCRQLESRKKSDVSAKTDGTCAQQDLPLLTLDDIPQTSSVGEECVSDDHTLDVPALLPDIKVNARHVDLPEVSSIVHVGQNHVHVASCANTCKTGPLRHVTAVFSSSNFTAQRTFFKDVHFLLDERRKYISQSHTEEVDSLDDTVDQQPDSHNNNYRSR